MQDEVISWVRRRSNAFARGKSKFRGVSGRVGRWETRIGSFGGMKNVSTPSFIKNIDINNSFMSLFASPLSKM